MVLKLRSNNADETTTRPGRKKGGSMKTADIDKVTDKVLQKLQKYMDTVEPERLNPQSLKHVTATLKDIRELQTDGVVPQLVVEFTNPEWNK